MIDTNNAANLEPPPARRQRPGAAFAVLLALWIVAVVAPIVFVLSLIHISEPTRPY